MLFMARNVDRVIAVSGQENHVFTDMIAIHAQVSGHEIIGGQVAFFS